MKLSRRGKRTKRTKRTKCTKRTKNIKCRRNTKKQFRQYKCKNTYRKHSHKLRKNKRVMSGGVGKYDKLFEMTPSETTVLEYTTIDCLSKVRNFFGSLQKGNFTPVFSCLQEKMKISFNTQNEPFINFDFRNNNFSNEFANEFANVTIEISSYNKNIYHVTFTLNTPDEYYFTLTITSTSEQSKTFTVNFKVSVKSYKIIFDKRDNIGKYECGNIDYDTLYGLDNEAYQVKPQNMTFTLSKPDQTTKTYTFPLSVEGSLNKNYFKSVESQIDKKIKEIIKQILETSISIRIKDSKKSEDKGLIFDIGGEKTALVGQLRSQVAKYLKTKTGNIILTLQPFESKERISLEDNQNLESHKGTFYYENVDLEKPSDPQPQQQPTASE